jgi:hypothetical protein
MAELVAALAVCLAILSLLDLLLSDCQKSSVGAVYLGLWNRLDDLKRLSPIFRLRHFDWRQRAVVILILTVIQPFLFSFLLYIHTGVALPPNFHLHSLAWDFVNAVGTLYVLSFRTLRGFLLRSIGVTIIVTAAKMFEVYILGVFWTIPSWLFVFSWGFCFIILALPVLLAYLITAFLALGEIVVRRIAENSKGPILALSALLGALAALLKTFA